MWAIIGGSGFENFENVTVLESYSVATPFGEPSSGLARIKIGDHECLFLSRHGKNHEKLPSEINYKANFFALKKLGAHQVVSLSAVGSLKQELKPGDLVVPSQFIDRTKSIRAHTYCGNGLVGHVSLAYPVCPYWSGLVRKYKSAKFSFDLHFDKTAVCIEGPCFSTYAESKSYIDLGADIIGMTSFPEYALAKEAGLGYLPLSFVTDYDCWNQDHAAVTLAEVISLMRKNNQKAFELVTWLLTQKSPGLDQLGYLEAGLKNALFTPKEALTTEQLEWLDVLTGNS